MKFLIFDAGPLISLSLSGMIDVLEKLKTKNVEFIITPQVKRETVDRAFLVKKYKLEAIRISNLIKRGILKMSSDFISDVELQKETSRIKNLAKKIISLKHEKVDIIHEGEASCLAFSKLSDCNCAIVIDERTTRLLTENPTELKSIIEKKTQMKLTLNKKELGFFEDFKFIRSSELVFVAFKNDLINLEKTRDTLDALLYNLKLHGTTIPSGEIEELKRLI